MTFAIVADAQATIIAVTGEIDLGNSSELRREVLGKLAEGRAVAVDLAGVAYIDSSGVAALVEAYQASRQRHLGFYLQNVSVAAMRVLKLARLDQVFDIRTRPSGEQT
ncbi:MAG TPA: STAS domain-containing protein [Rhodospirillaceae bacterium]|nr:STAS domain-containing protein [Rhodospirillaceae bacterium]